MRYVPLRIVTRAAASLVALAVGAATAYAVDGVVLINQTAALNGNVTPGDAPGFPVTISVSGSYRLSSNLTVPDAATTAIKVLVDDVTIDLNGFSIVGPTVCSAGSCSPLGQGNGVEALTTNVKVFNGNVRGMGFRGVQLTGTLGFVEKVHAIFNGATGILVSNGIVSLSSATSNGNDGIIAISVIGSFSESNGQNGIHGTQSVNNSVAVSNGNQGILVTGCPAVVVSSSARDNQGSDIATAAGCVRANNAPEP